MSLPKLTGYAIEQPLASGGMAKIYLGRQLSLNREVAIKFLSRPLIEHSEAKQLFDAESLIIAQLNHPNIVQIYDRGTADDGQPYFVMEKINGVDLSSLLAQGELPFNKKLDIAIQACRGLAYAHKNGIIHRDIKPSNIIIDQHGVTKILDFGIALSASFSDTSDMSSVMGTEGYVAPEVIDDYNRASFASDVYSMGVVFFDLFADKAENGNCVDPERLPRELPQALKDLLMRCVHPDPTKRYQSLAEVRDQLLQISSGSHLDSGNRKAAEQDNADLSQHFQLLDVLSKSAKKRVYLFQKKSNQQLIVIKNLLNETRGYKQAKLFTSLRHPNIVRIFAAARNNGNITIISEYLPGGSLQSQMIQEFDESRFLLIACQICSAIAFAHQNNILHGNLSPNNVLFDEHGNAKVNDFGQTLNSNDDPVCQRRYHPPATQSYSEQFDIYCLGAIFHHMLYGYVPGERPPKQRKKIMFRLEKLIDSMIAINPQDRPLSAQQVLVELQRIALKDNPRRPSAIGKPLDENPSAPQQKKSQSSSVPEKHTPPAQNKVNLWLVFALILSLGIIAGLLARDLLR